MRASWGDLNKGISSISYNILNKPEEVNYTDGRKLVFTYDATGKKLGFTAYDATSTILKQNDYVANCVYEGQVLQFIQTEEGRLIPQGNKVYEAEFYFKDYLGNIREVYKKGVNGEVEIVEEHHYYPFGMQISGLNIISSLKNPYLYQGKEFFDEFDLNLHYFGARMFDSQLGRWHSNDPLIIFASPYNGMGNNPVSLVDPTGMKPGWPWNKKEYPPVWDPNNGSR
jgi:RHS repeat-associated protein